MRFTLMYQLYYVLDALTGHSSLTLKLKIDASFFVVINFWFTLDRRLGIDAQLGTLMADGSQLVGPPYRIRFT